MILNRKKLLALNTGASLFNQIVTIICGFVLPVLILQAFGSAVNGLVSSITQFLGFISLVELGIGAVAQSALYKPLAEKNNTKISQIYVSARRFYRTIALILLAYILFLIAGYPILVDTEFDYLYTAGLIICIAISLFAQYYFGIVNQILLSADQRGYIFKFISSGTFILNTIACVVLINMDYGIHIVKLGTSIIYLLRPLLMIIYVRKHYTIDDKITYDKEPIEQKWNGIAQHFATVVIGSAGTVILTCVSSLTNVSVYAIYSMVVSALKQLIISLSGGVQALMGELLAKQDFNKLIPLFAWTEWSFHTGSVGIFGATMVLIMPFVQVYTRNITDAEYAVPLFAVLITLGSMGHCLRLPYNIMILAAGHYRQTQNNYIVAAVMNIIISVITVKIWGLVGVAVGMLAAMIYQTIWMANYISKEIIHWPMRNFWKQFGIDCLLLIIIYFSTQWIELGDKTYINWCIMAAKVVIIVLIEVIIVNLIFYRDHCTKIVNKIIKRKG